MNTIKIESGEKNFLFPVNLEKLREFKLDSLFLAICAKKLESVKECCKKLAKTKIDIFKPIRGDNLNLLHVAALCPGGEKIVKVLIEHYKLTQKNYLPDEIVVIERIKYRAFNIAYLAGNKETMNLLIENDLKPSFALMVQKGDLESIKYWISRGMEVNTPTFESDNFTLFEYSCFKKQYHIAKYLIENKLVDLHRTNSASQSTCLDLVAMFNWLDLVKLLIEQGASINAQNKNGETPLHRIFQILLESRTTKEKRESYENIIYCLIDNNCDLSIEDENGNTPLHLASAFGHKFIQKIIEKGGKVLLEKRNKSQETPLYIAMMKGSISGFIYLADNYKASLEVRDFTGSSLFHLAAAGEDHHLLEALIRVWKKRNLENLKEWINKTAVIDRREIKPLHLAVRCSTKKSVEILINEGADINAHDNVFGRPLSFAISLNSLEKVELLLNSGADVNYFDYKDPNSIFIAAIHNNMAMINLLHSYGARLNESHPFQNPMIGAFLYGRKQIIEELVKMGCKDPFEEEAEFNTIGCEIAGIRDFLQTLYNYIQDPQKKWALISKGDGKGYFPLSKAVLKNNKDDVKFLLEKGVDPKVMTYKGKSLFLIALKKEFYTVAKVLADYVVLEDNFKSVVADVKKWQKVIKSLHSGVKKIVVAANKICTDWEECLNESMNYPEIFEIKGHTTIACRSLIRVFNLLPEIQEQKQSKVETASTHETEKMKRELSNCLSEFEGQYNALKCTFSSKIEFEKKKRHHLQALSEFEKISKSKFKDTCDEFRKSVKLYRRQEEEERKQVFMPFKKRIQEVTEIKQFDQIETSTNTQNQRINAKYDEAHLLLINSLNSNSQLKNKIKELETNQSTQERIHNAMLSKQGDLYETEINKKNRQLTEMDQQNKALLKENENLKKMILTLIQGPANHSEIALKMAIENECELILGLSAIKKERREQIEKMHKEILTNKCKTRSDIIGLLDIMGFKISKIKGDHEKWVSLEFKQQLILAFHSKSDDITEGLIKNVLEKIIYILQIIVKEERGY